MNNNVQKISVEEGITVVVKAHGNLDIQGWEQPDVAITTDINVQKVRHEKDLLRLLFVEDCDLSIPDDVKLIIERASGNTRIRNINLPITINRVYGNLALRDVGPVTISKVAGNCLVENVKGDLNISKVGGNLKGQNLFGSVVAEKVSGDVKLHGIQGGIRIRASQSAEISLSESSEYDITLQASDNIVLNLPLDADAKLKIKSRAEKIDFNLSKISETIKERNCELILGDGNQDIVLDAGEKVRITEQRIDPSEIVQLFDDLDDLWKKLREESNARREASAKQVHWEIKMVEGAAQIAQDVIVEAGSFADLITDETIRQAEEHVRTALERVEQQIRNIGYDYWSDRYEDDEEISSDITAEERLVIMRMLQENKISVEEADKLLEILENPFV
ncbi:MAG: hypothetical protein MUO76_18045 [Anaerolineaceae bacterium]|nr:hypothetical protein [Anaerolineaceae bacterium]